MLFLQLSFNVKTVESVENERKMRSETIFKYCIHLLLKNGFPRVGQCVEVCPPDHRQFLLLTLMIRLYDLVWKSPF